MFRIITVLSFPLVAFFFLIIWVSTMLRRKDNVHVIMRFMGMTLNISAGKEGSHLLKRKDDPAVELPGKKE